MKTSTFSKSAARAVSEVERLRAAFTRSLSQNAALRAALAESVRLQSHYAALLNQYDGGNRKGFCDAQEWIDRLAALAKAKGKT